MYVLERTQKVHQETLPQRTLQPKNARTQYPGAGGSGRTLSGRTQKVHQETLPQGSPQHCYMTETGPTKVPWVRRLRAHALGENPEGVPRDTPVGSTTTH